MWGGLLMWRVVLVTVLLAVPARASAQTAGELLRDAQTAFENLEFERAAELYLLVLSAGAGANRAQRDTAQLYLGVAYEYSDQRQNALATFRTLVRSNPCAPVPQEFGASVARLIGEARRGIVAVGLCDFREQRLAAGDSVSLTIALTRPSVVLVLLQGPSGSTVAQIGQNLPEGTSELRWAPQLDPTRYAERPTPLSLILRARDESGTATAQDSVAVLVRAYPVDTLSHPAPLREADLLPEQRSMNAAIGDLGKGLFFGVGIAATSLLTYSSLRGEYVKALSVGGAVSLAGIVALAKGSSNRGIPENRLHNETVRSAWAASRDSVVTINRSRLAARELVLEPVGGRP
jgi:hypothetical protein